MTADVQRMGQSLSFPGIDPRTWVAMAVVTAVHVSRNGVKVDIELLNSGKAETARVGTIYAGVGVTMYLPIAVDDEVVVGFADGHADAGLVVLARVHSPSDPLPDAVVNNPNDVYLVVSGDANVNLVVDGGKVRLGGDSGTAPVARVGDKVRITQAQLTAAGATANGFPVVISSPAPPPDAYIECTIVSGANKTEAK